MHLVPIQSSFLILWTCNSLCYSFPFLLFWLTRDPLNRGYVELTRDLEVTANFLHRAIISRQSSSISHLHKHLIAMSEVRSRPSAPRGRGSTRGSRGGGYSSRGGRGGSRQVNGDKPEIEAAPAYEGEGEIGQLKKLYTSELATIKEMFPGWTNEDIVFALQETGGDLEGTIERMSEGIISHRYYYSLHLHAKQLYKLGNISQWGEVKKKTKDRSQSKAKEAATPLNESMNTSNRGGRTRTGTEVSRGGRGRGSERGRGAGRGGRGGSTMNGSRGANAEKGTTEAVSSNDSGSWDMAIPKADGIDGGMDQTEADTTPLESSWENVTVPDAASAPTAEVQKPSSKPDGTRSWASMLYKPVVVPAPPKAPQAAPVQETPTEAPATVSDPVQMDMPVLPRPIQLEEPNSVPPPTPPTPTISTEPAADITPSKDELTETNLEQLPDTSTGPPNTATAASTVASTIDPRGGAASSTPLHASQPQSAPRPPMGGFATSAYKATGLPGRSASFQRKILEQQEAVVMPGKHAVDRAAVQFGSMGLNGSAEDVDFDSDREEAETRAQPPQHSPIAPRATLPPAPQQHAFTSQAMTSDSLPIPRQAPGLPPPTQQPDVQQSIQGSMAEPNASQQPTQSNHPYNQFNNRYGPQAQQSEPSAPAQKAYEPFGQQMQQPPHQFDGYPSASQAPSQPQHTQSHMGGYSSAPNDMSSYYTSDSQRNAYQNYYGSYGQQSQQSLQDSGMTQQRTGSAVGVSQAEPTSQHATSQAHQQPQSRYGQAVEAHTSGNSTPNPAVPGQPQHHQHQQHQPQQSQQMHQQQGQGQGAGQPGGYPYGHPYYASPYYSAYMNQVSNHPYGRDRPMFDDARRYDDQYLTHMNQFGYGGSQGGYGGSPFAGGAGAGKQGMYGQPHQGYGMSPQTGYDQHSSSPANVGGFGQQHSGSGRDGAPGSNLGYGRTGSTQPSESQQQYPASSGASYGGMPDVFARSQSGYSGQQQGLGHQPQAGVEDSTRGYSEASKVSSGPSPAPGQAAGRPVSATNMQGQGLPPPQGQGQSQQGYTGYPSHLNPQMHGQQGSQYGAGPGGLGGHHQAGGQNHQGSGYGQYGAGLGGNYYGGNNTRGGWGGNYGH